MTSGVVWAGAIAALLTVYLFDPATNAFYPLCPFRSLTGLLCPGCGGTRAVAALLHGRLAEAWNWNPVVVVSVCLSPAALVLWTYKKRLLDPALWTFGTAALCFGVLRNF